MAVRTTYHPGGYIAAAPQRNKSEEYDSVANTYTTWNPAGIQLSQRALTAAEQAVLAADDVASTASQNQATLQQRAQSALAANATFLAIGAPTNAQTLAQVQNLTKECNGLIRLALNLLDSTAGT